MTILTAAPRSHEHGRIVRQLRIPVRLKPSWSRSADAEQRGIGEINSGIYASKLTALAHLGKLNTTTPTWK